MNSICGIFDAGAGAPDGGSFRKMLEELRRIRPGASRAFTCRGLALGNVSREADTAHETAFPCERNGCFATGISRIHNRDELSEALGLPDAEQKLLPDAMLFLHCHEKWGYDCAARIRGEWLFVLYDFRRNELFVACSRYWRPRFHYCMRGGVFYFSSLLPGLFASGNIPMEPDELRIGQLAFGVNGFAGRSAYSGISVLPPAHTLRISGGHCEEKRYWALENTAPIRLPKDGDYVDAFRELYANAVESRIGKFGACATTLSGGLDSGSVTALAARSLKAAGRTLEAYSSVPLYEVRDCPERPGDESEWIDATASHAGNVHVNYIHAENISPLQALRESLDAFGEPLPSYANLNWMTAIVRRARADNFKTLLVGQTGNLTVSWRGGMDSFWDWQGFLAALEKPGFQGLAGTLRAVKRHLASPALSCLLLHRREAHLNRRALHIQNSPINPDLALRHDFLEDLRQLHPVRFLPSPRNTQLWLLKPQNFSGDTLHADMGAREDLWISDPTADERLLEFCVSIPNDQFRRNGEEKFLFKRAMKDLLPDSVLMNTRRGAQGADLLRRLQKETSELQDITATMQKSPICRHYLDVDKIGACIGLLSRNDRTAFLSASHILLNGVAMGLFLQRFE